MSKLALILTRIKLHLPLNIAVDAASIGTLPDNFVHNLRTTFESRKEQAPNLYSHLEFSVDSFQGVSQ